MVVKVVAGHGSALGEGTENVGSLTMLDEFCESRGRRDAITVWQKGEKIKCRGVCQTKGNERGMENRD